MEPGGSTVDVFDGVEFSWACVETGGDDKKKGKGGGGNPRESLEFSFDAEHTETALGRYVPFVMYVAEQLQLRDRALRIFMNEGQSWYGMNHHHPTTFDTLAMDPTLKQSVVADLDRFLGRRDYYRRIGKAWKRGYLLYGPAGTGKSAMIAAMANYLDYDIYDIELTSVHSNTDLRKLFIETTSKSIIVIEDIDCSLDLTGARKNKAAEDDDKDKKDGGPPFRPPGEKKDTSSKVTLSGLLNFIDGLWSACGGERIIVFTTNHVEKLDPALIRRGRMDKHIEMSYCGFEAFKFLAKTYLDVDSHPLFDAVGELLREVQMTPADVAENLTPKSLDDGPDSCLADLVKALEEAKEKKASGGDEDEQNQQDEEEQ